MATVQRAEAERQARSIARDADAVVSDGVAGMQVAGTRDAGARDAGTQVAGTQAEGERARADRETLLLLQRYRKRKTVKVRNDLIERHRRTVASIARSLSARLPRSVDVQDLVHAGIWGLMQAIENFDATRQIPFAQFMRSRVRGAMLDELRNLDYLPRLYRQLHRERDGVVQALRAELLRDPSDAEIASRLGVTETRLRRVASSVQEPSVVSGDRSRASDGSSNRLGAFGIDHLPDRDSASPFEAFDRRDLLDAIKDSLQPIEWQVLEMHYLQGIPGKEIAQQLRLSASRICQIHGRVLTRLKARLTRG